MLRNLWHLKRSLRPARIFQFFLHCFHVSLPVPDCLSGCLLGKCRVSELVDRYTLLYIIHVLPSGMSDWLLTSRWLRIRLRRLAFGKQLHTHCSHVRHSFDSLFRRVLTPLIYLLLCLFYPAVVKIYGTSRNQIFPCLPIWWKFFPGVYVCFLACPSVCLITNTECIGWAKNQPTPSYHNSDIWSNFQNFLAPSLTWINIITLAYLGRQNSQ